MSVNEDKMILKCLGQCNKPHIWDGQRSERAFIDFRAAIDDSDDDGGRGKFGEYQY